MRTTPSCVPPCRDSTLSHLVVLRVHLSMNALLLLLDYVLVMPVGAPLCQAGSSVPVPQSSSPAFTSRYCSGYALAASGIQLGHLSKWSITHTRGHELLRVPPEDPLRVACVPRFAARI